MAATDKFEWIAKQIAEGRTVHLQTATKATKITPKTWKSFAAKGHPVIKVSGNSLMLISGRSYVCADYCAIHAA